MYNALIDNHLKAIIVINIDKMAVLREGYLVENGYMKY